MRLVPQALERFGSLHGSMGMAAVLTHTDQMGVGQPLPTSRAGLDGAYKSMVILDVGMQDIVDTHTSFRLLQAKLLVKSMSSQGPTSFRSRHRRAVNCSSSQQTLSTF